MLGTKTSLSQLIFSTIIPGLFLAGCCCEPPIILPSERVEIQPPTYRSLAACEAQVNSGAGSCVSSNDQIQYETQSHTGACETYCRYCTDGTETKECIASVTPLNVNVAARCELDPETDLYSVSCPPVRPRCECTCPLT